ncbi:MAG: hypothetical protein R3E01_04255 [Pirellulaceae bacterium]|nr:hypothetical protein [Planctomycetales bacterium]
MSAITRVINSINHMFMSMNSNHWAILAVLLVGVGVICMRGFGSRKNY